MHFEESVIDASSDSAVDVAVYTTGFAGNGPQMAVRINHGEVILSHHDATKFFQAVSDAARYLGLKIEP